MATPTLLEQFHQSTANTLLKSLLEVYDSSLDLPQDARVSRLVEELTQILEESANANPEC